MEQINFSEHSRAAHFGHRKLTPRACVVDSKKHLRLFLSDALEDLGFVTCECGQAGDLAGVLQAEQPDLIVLSVCVDGINVGEILEVIVRRNFGGKVLVIGQPDSIMVKAVRQIGDEYGIAMLPSLQTPFGAASLRASVAELLPAEPAPSPAVDVAEALKAGWLELWYQQKINTRTLVPSGAEALVRMRHPAWGVVPPAYFIPDDKDPHFRGLSEFVVGRAIEDWRYLLESQGPVDLSINLPVSFFGNAAAVRDLCRAMPAHPAFGGLLIEINSSEVIDHPDLAVDAAKTSAPAQYRDRDRQCRRGMAVSAGTSELPVRRTEGRPAIYQRLRGRPAEADGMPAYRRAGPGQRRPRHRPGRGDPRRFSRRSRHGVRSGPGLPVRQAGGGAEICPLPASARCRLRQAVLSQAHSNFMSMHFAMSEPRPDEMMMQPRTFGLLLSLAHTA